MLVRTAVEVFRALTHADPFQAGRYLATWLSLVASHFPAHAEAVVELVELVEFNKRRRPGEEELALLDLEISGPSPAQRALAVFSQLVEDHALARPKELSRAVAALVSKLADRHSEEALKLLADMAAVEAGSRRWMAPAVRAVAERFGCRKVL